MHDSTPFARPGRLWAAALMALSLGAQAQSANLLVNGDFSQAGNGWSGLINQINAISVADDAFVGQPLVNLALEAGAVRFQGFYETQAGVDYHYRLAPPKPHLSQTLQLDAGHYTLSWTDVVSSRGMQGTMALEVLLDGVQVAKQSFWTVTGKAPSGSKSFAIGVASTGSHTLSLGLTLPGFLPNHVYFADRDQILIDNLSLSAVAGPAPVPEPHSLGMMLAGLLGGAALRWRRQHGS
ncbi:putative PEP-CTERM domain-containing protein [Rubrivivax sp. A210]|uniref:PEP-CTERM sorting domain-containing protein n=1 Tax=Rubrivivax sp. A210 TaxID=2772301 RepID=UPI001917BFF1|nr:PEP-CTERM sorting domain-containing protein [Rubrivivax sp. A210]CAD5373331.1 putative PEP-CTERM domain-containing protein [Rubrivivax sp. A210]